MSAKSSVRRDPALDSWNYFRHCFERTGGWVGGGLAVQPTTSGCATVEMVAHTKPSLALLLLGATILDIRGQSVVFPSNTDDAIVIEPAHLRKVPVSSLPVRWKRLNRLKNIWSEREINRTDIMGKVKPMDNEVEWGTEIFQTMKDGNLCGDGSTYCTRPSYYPGVAIARALKKNKKKELINVLFDEPKAQLRLRSGIFAKSADETFDDEFENVCGSVRRTIAPKVGTNTNNQQRYLVQGDIDLAEFSGLVRTVQTVECLGSQLPGERESCGVLPGRRTECRQEYTEHRMVALDMEKGELVVEAFNFPSCCSCMVHRGYDL